MSDSEFWNFKKSKFSHQVALFIYFFFFLLKIFKHTYNLFGFRIFAGLPGLPGL